MKLIVEHLIISQRKTALASMIVDAYIQPPNAARCVLAYFIVS